MLKINVLLMLFYGFCRLLFAGDTFFRFRRAMLLLLVVAAFVLPLVDIGWWVEEHRSTVNLVEAYQEVMLPTVEVTGDATRFPWMRLFTLLYIGGVAVLGARFLVQLLTIVRLIATSERRVVEGCRVCVLTDDASPFSFFGWIFVNPDAQSDSQLHEILIHEQTHAREWHSLDIMLMELCTIACWWNLFVWLLRREVRLNLEYLADDRVVALGSERKAYQYHLLGLAYGRNVATISNNFTVLPLKLRIKMMNKKRTNRLGRAKYVLVLPLAAALLVASNVESVARTGHKAEVVSVDSVSPRNALVVATPEQDEKVFDVVEQMPEFPGGLKAMTQFLMENVRYPQEAQKKGVQGYVVVTFVVDAKDGRVRNAAIARSVDPLLDAEALRVVQSMPNWKPGMQNGEAVNVKFALPVSFRLSEPKKADGAGAPATELIQLKK